MTARADLVVVGRVATLAGEAGFGWVEAVGIAGGRVVRAGSRAEVETAAAPGARRIVLAPDEVAIPGLTDGHLHLAEGGLTADRPDLTGIATLEEAVGLLAAAERRLAPGAWLQGHGWTADRWQTWPTAEALERAAPGRPAALWAHDHHALWVNETALAAAGIDDRTLDPDGGLIRRDDRGAATGILHESASRLVTGHIPAPGAGEIERGIRALAAELLALGVVAVHDPGGLAPVGGLGPAFEAYRRLAADRSFRLRVHACVREEQLSAAVAAGLRSGNPLGPPDGRIRFGWLKLFADGTLGSRTAALLEPIEPVEAAGLPAGTARGVWITPPDRLGALAGTAADAGIACMIHAIGDAAVRAGLDALGPTASRAPLMPRLEHVQLLAPADRPRFAASGVAASVQPVHLRSDAAAARRLWGVRAEAHGYPWATLLRSGATLAFGTDAPVESIDPWPGLEMAVARRSAAWPSDAATFGPSEALSLPEALRAACVAPAATARETDRGRLVPGQRADLVVLAGDALAEPVAPGGPLGRARPRLVLVDGEVAFEA